MTSKAIIKRMATGIPGFDEVLGGGLPEFSFNLIAGRPGCGKTTLAHQIMFALATPERPAIYFTVLGEPPIKMLRYQQQFAFFDAAAVNGRVRFVSLADDAATGELDRVLQRIVAEVAAHRPGLIFVDSFRSVVLASQHAGRPQTSLQLFVQQLGLLLTSWQATTFLIGEYFDETDANPVFTVADGLVWLHQSVQRNSMVRKLEVMKMRGQASLPGLHSFRIDGTGIRVFAPAQRVGADGGAAAAAGDRARTGVAELDAMLGGGLPRGYSLLVAGPSGSGKSVLAAAFLSEGARNGETGVVAAFEQHPNAARSPVLSALLEQGRVGLVDQREPDLSIDEIVLLILTEVRRLGAGPGADLPCRLPRVAAGAGDGPRPGRRDPADDLRAGRPVHRPAVQSLRRGVPHRCHHRAALHRGGQPAPARHGRRQGAGEPPLRRTPPVPHRRRWTARRTAAARPRGAARRTAHPQAGRSPRVARHGRLSQACPAIPRPRAHRLARPAPRRRPRASSASSRARTR
jgi:circadian clock protein KaiC